HTCLRESPVILRFLARLGCAPEARRTYSMQLPPERVRVLRAWWPKAFSILLFAAPAIVLCAGAFAHLWVDDDAFIALRLVRSLLHGAGLVFNPGERVEAGTSALWLFVLALLGALGIRLEYAAAYTGIALTLAALMLGQWAARVASNGWGGRGSLGGSREA